MSTKNDDAGKTKAKLLRELEALRQQIVAFESDESTLLNSDPHRQIAPEHYPLLLDQAGIGIGYYALDGTILLMNRKALDNMNRSAAEVVGKSMKDVFEPEIAALIQQRMQDVLRTGQDQHYPYDEVEFHAGKQYYASTYTAIKDTNGEIIGIQTVSLEVTLRTQAELILRASKQSLDKAQRVAKLGSYDWNLATGDVKWSDQMYRIFGVDPETYIPTADKFADFVYPDDLHIISPENTEKILKQHYHELEYRIIERHTQEVKDILLIGEVIYDENGQPERVLGTLQDITERKRDEEALRISQAEYRTLFESSPTSLWVEDFSATKDFLDDLHAQGIHDLDSYFKQYPDMLQHCVSLIKIVDVNQVTMELFAADSKADFMQNLDYFMVDDSYAVIQQELVALWGGATTFRAEIAGRTHDGQTLHLNIFLAIAPGFEDTWEKIYVSVVDITEQKRTEEKLKAYQTQLETLVNERTADLQAAHSRLQELDQLKDQFINHVSHELRSPITILKTNHHLLSLKPEKSDQFLERLQQATTRLEHIVEATLYIPQLQRQLQDMKPVSLDMNQLVVQAVQSYEPVASGRGQTFTLTQDKQIAHITGDAELIVRMVEILLDNAIKYTPDTATIQVGLKQQTEDDRMWVCLTVSDNGPGIPEDEQPLVFDSFFRGRIALEKRLHGAGLGLYIAREIAQRHGGRISLQSMAGQETTFTVWLPSETD